MRYLVYLLLLSGCATPQILLEKNNPPRVCPAGMENTAFPTSGKVNCQAINHTPNPVEEGIQ